MTSLLYSTYLGGTQADSGRSVAAVAPNAVYISGKTTSWDFPWLNNLQPFTGNEDAFVANFRPHRRRSCLIDLRHSASRHCSAGRHRRH